MEWVPTTTSSGLKIATQYSDLPNSMLSVFIKGGSKYENKMTQGYSHLLEHLFLNNKEFKNTIVDGYTTKELISLQFKQKQEDTLKTLKSIQKILDRSNFHNHFTQSIIDKEKDVILKELIDVNDDKNEKAMEKIHKKLDCLYKFPILGARKTIRKFNLKTLKSFYDKIMNPNNIAILIQSNIKDSMLVNHLNKKTKGEGFLVVKGFNNYDFLVYFLLQEIYNLNSNIVQYIPYKDFAIFKSNIDFTKILITEKMFKQGKTNLLTKIKNRSKQINDLVDDIGYSLLYFDKIIQYDSIIDKVKDITYENLKNIFK